SEEIARNEVFIKYSRSGNPTYLGKQPDADLKHGEAVMAINRQTGERRVQNTNGLTDSDAMAQFGPHLLRNFGPSPSKMAAMAPGKVVGPSVKAEATTPLTAQDAERVRASIQPIHEKAEWLSEAIRRRGETNQILSD